jgi:hypothetical protein
VNGTAEFFKNSASTRIISFLNYLRITSQANYLVSALNTNLVIAIGGGGDQYLFYRFPTTYSPYAMSVYQISCDNENPTSAASFESFFYTPNYLYHMNWMEPAENSKIVSGFFGGCTPLEALLRSTLDCLYDITCLQLLIEYFPALNQVCVALSYLSYIFFCLDTLELDGFCFTLDTNKYFFKRPFAQSFH